MGLASTKCTLAKRIDTVTFKHTWRKPGFVCLLRHQQGYNKETHKLAPSIRKSEMQKELQEHNLTSAASQSQGKIPSSGEKKQRFNHLLYRHFCSADRQRQSAIQWWAKHTRPMLKPEQRWLRVSILDGYWLAVWPWISHMIHQPLLYHLWEWHGWN